MKDMGKMKKGMSNNKMTYRICTMEKQNIRKNNMKYHQKEILQEKEVILIHLRTMFVGSKKGRPPEKSTRKKPLLEQREEKAKKKSKEEPKKNDEPKKRAPAKCSYYKDLDHNVSTCGWFKTAISMSGVKPPYGDGPSNA
jgi:hypothetical protein